MATLHHGARVICALCVLRMRARNPWAARGFFLLLSWQHKGGMWRQLPSVPGLMPAVFCSLSMQKRPEAQSSAC